MRCPILLNTVTLICSDEIASDLQNVQGSSCSLTPGFYTSSYYGCSISQESQLGVQAPGNAASCARTSGFFVGCSICCQPLSVSTQSNEEEGQHFTCCLRPLYLSLPIQVALFNSHLRLCIGVTLFQVMLVMQ